MTQTLTRRSLILGSGAVAALTLAGCNASAGSGSGSQPSASGGATFSYTDARGKKIDIARPDVVVAQSSAAASLWDFGFKVKGAYGELKTENGKLNYQAGNLDLSQITVVGDTYGAFDVEKYAALGPQLLIDLCFTPGQLWYVPEKSAQQIETLAPTLGVEMLNSNLLQIIERFSALAALLGADVTSSAVTQAKTAFEAEVATVKAAVAAKPDLTVVGLSADKDTVYIANPLQHPDLAYLKELGVTFVDPKSKATEYFKQVSWEKLDDYSADVVMIDSRVPELVKGAEQQATYRALPAVKAGQVYAWKPAAPYSYTASTPIFAEYAKALSGAKTLGV